MTHKSESNGQTDAIEKALQWLEAGHKVALACVLQTWGSAPRPSGSLMAIREDGLFEGSVSGGCVEGEVITSAEDVIASGLPKTLTFGVANNRAWEVGLACGGEIRIYLHALGQTDERLLKDIQQARHDKNPVVLVLDLAGGDHHQVAGEQNESPPTASKSLRLDRALLLEDASQTLFYIPFNPPLRLFIIGAVHVAKPLTNMALTAGFDVTVIDPRSAFRDAADFGRASVDGDWPDEALARAGLDARTALVTLTHDPKLDDAGLIEGLKSEAFYIGCLGSRKTHHERRERLGANGVSDHNLDRLDGPVGLDIGARSPEEIAVAILAGIIKSLRKPA